MAQTQNQQIQNETQSQIDKRAIVAIARAVAKKKSFVVWYGDIYDELRDIIEDGDEFHEVENKLYEDIVEGRIKNVHRVQGPCGDSDCDIVIVSPVELDKEKLKIVEELAQLYSFKGYDGDEDEREELTQTLHNLVKLWSSGCMHMSGPAEAVYVLAKNYGFEIREDVRLNHHYAGNIYYEIESLNLRLIKWVDYCNDCINFSTNNNFIEKCVGWRFED